MVSVREPALNPRTVAEQTRVEQRLLHAQLPQDEDDGGHDADRSSAPSTSAGPSSPATGPSMMP